MADDDYLDAATFSKLTKELVSKAREQLLGKIQESLDAAPATFSVEMMEDALRSFATNGYMTRVIPGRSFHAHPTAFKPRPIRDAFGTDLRQVDRMANPYQPGTPEHGQWMMHWIDVQCEQVTPAYRQRVAQVRADIEAMEDACAPVANWVDEILFEVAEARDECENVEEYHGVTTVECPTSSLKPSITMTDSMVLFGGYDDVDVIADEWTEIEFDQIESTDDQQVWRATWHLWPKKNTGITDLTGC